MKKAIIVGATSGIGRALAKLLAENDYKVGVTGRRTNLLIDIQNEKPESYIIESFDISDTRSISEHLTTLTQKLGGLDLLVISSGTGDLNDTLDFSIEKRTIDTNVNGFTAIADWAFNYFEQQKYGHLVAISSVAGLRGNRSAPSYAASKAYQINYLQGLKQKAQKIEGAVIITDIRPGFVDTPMAQGNVFWVASVDKAARQIYTAIKCKKKTAYITKRWGIVALVMRLVPGWIYNRM